MKRAKAGTHPSYPQAAKRLQKSSGGKRRKGYSGVNRTQGAAVVGEMKYMDSELQTSSLVAVTTTWPAGTNMDPTTTINLGGAAIATPQNLCSPKVGSALNERIGRQIHVLKIKVRGTISFPQATAVNGGEIASKCRIILVQDKQTNAGLMTGAQLMRDAGLAQTTINSFQNPDNFGRFRVLKDVTYVLQDPNVYTDAAAAPAQNGRKTNFKFNVNFKKPVVVHFNATNGGTGADIVDNSFHVFAAVDHTGLNPQIAYYSRVAYKE